MRPYHQQRNTLYNLCTRIRHWASGNAGGVVESFYPMLLMSWIQLQPCSNGQTLPLRKSSRNSIIEPYYLGPFRSPLMSQHTMLYCMYRTTLFCRGHIQFGPVVHLPSNQFLIQWGATGNSYDANPNAVGCKQLNSSWFDFACHFIFKPKFTRPFLSGIISTHVAFKFLLCIFAFDSMKHRAFP